MKFLELDNLRKESLKQKRYMKNLLKKTGSAQIRPTYQNISS